MAWVLPLVLLVSGLAQSAAMFCRMQGVVAAKACCCAEAARGLQVEPPTSTVHRQGCCESMSVNQDQLLAVVTPHFEIDPPVWSAGFVTAILAPQTCGAPLRVATQGHPPQPPNRPLVVLKHAFLI